MTAAKRKRIMVWVIIALSALLICGAVVIIGVRNKSLVLTEIRVGAREIPEAFDGLRIVHLSDLHNTELGRDNEKLLAMIEKAGPDVIVMTGDLIDTYKTDTDVSIAFVERVSQIAPCFYVMGNHEGRLPAEYKRLKNAMVEAGVEVLENRTYTLERDGEIISFIGLQDFVYNSPHLLPTLKELSAESGGYRIVLSHKPDFIEEYEKGGADLVFCGHAHGGQIHLPLIGGVIAPGQGFFPEYYEGMHQKGNMNMIISRGLGNSLFPFRVNNRPEVILAVLESENTEK